MERRRMDEAEVRAALASLPGWELRHGRLHRELAFSGFGEAFGFMCRVALLAERLNHHPDWRNSYNRVSIDLITHDLGALSTYDVELARRIDQLLPD